MTDERYQEIRKAIEKGQKAYGVIANIAANMVINGDETTPLTLLGAAEIVDDVLDDLDQLNFWAKKESQEKQDETKKISLGDALTCISNICENSDCDSCPFFDREADECVMEGNAPSEWKLPKDAEAEEDE